MPSQQLILRSRCLEPEDFTIFRARSVAAVRSLFASGGLLLYEERPEINETPYPLLRVERDAAPTSWHGPVSFRGPNDTELARGRGAVCGCYAGAHWSITFRRQWLNRNQRSAYQFGRADDASKYKADASRTRGFLNTFEQQVEVIYQAITPSTEFTDGLVVIAGSTGVGKSKIARGLIFKVLAELRESHRAAGKRRPHLVTFEDPIEKYLFENRDGTALPPGRVARKGFDYTPRQKGLDVDSLEQAILDCFRQTPSVFYVGETRNERDWRLLTQFAGSGHLVVTTTHAGTLVEALRRILSALGADTPMLRAEAANRIRAIVHLRAGADDQDRGFVLPALWRNTSTGVQALVAEGLSSLLPNRESEQAPEQAQMLGSVGRLHFSEQLARRNGAVMRRAAQWDLEGV